MHRDSKETSLFMLCMNVINSMTHWLLGSVATISIVFAIMFPGSSHFVQHVYLCTIGYVVLMAEAILTFSPTNGWSRNLTHRDKKVIHWVMQIIGSILAITGSIIRSVNIASNFTSPHGIFGIIALILTGLSLIGGIISLYTNKSITTKLFHSCAGSLTLIAAFTCLCFAFDKPVFKGVLGATTANLGISFTVIALVGTLCSASFTSFKRLMKR